MLLKYRPAKVDDLPECLSKLRNRFAYTEQEQRSLITLWHDLIRHGGVNFALVEDADAPIGDRILAFSCQVFVPDSQIGAILQHDAPSVGHYLLRETSSRGAPTLVLSALQAANSSTGVNMVLMSYGASSRFIGTDRASLFPQSPDWFLYAMGGYRLRFILFEIYDHCDWLWAEGFGCRLYRDRSRTPGHRREWEVAAGASGARFPHNERDGMLAQPPALRSAGLADAPEPRLYGMPRPNDTRLMGTLAGYVFGEQLPRFDFTTAQQQLLLHSLFGATDEELAADLGIAKVSVKKRWGAIYEKVRDTAPDVFPAHLARDEGPSRIAQKRRRLLGYIRHHMEELRPYEKR